MLSTSPIALPAAPPTVLSTAVPSVLPVADVQWNEGSFWGQRLDACRLGTLPSMSQLMHGTDRSHFIENFRVAAGLSAGRHRGPAWNDGDTYKWIEAMAAMLAQTKDPQLRDTLDAVIEVIGKAQRSDGYLHTPVLIAQRHGENDARPFGDPINFEMYNVGHLMTAACVHFEVTRDRSLLDIAIKATDFLDREFSRPNAELARHAICPAHYMGALDLYRTTKEPRYLQLCQRWLAMRDLVQGGDDNQDRLPFSEQREIVGHAVRANYLYAGAADLVLESADPAITATLESCWESLQQRKIYITGGCGALFDGASPDGSEQQKSITRIHQAYGRNYQLPNATAHNETCAAIGNLLWNYRMWRLSQDAKYIDALETSLYNAVLAGVSLDGKKFFYTNTLRQLDSMPVELRWSRERQAWISCYCCPPNVARTIAGIGRYAYSANSDATYVLLYGSNRLNTKLPDGTSVSLTQSADYPVSGQVVLEVNAAPERPYTFILRIPGWCQRARLSINGAVQAIAMEPSSFLPLTRTWMVGDRIELQMEMPTKLIAAHPLVEECRGQVAVQRGPLVYCVESVDLPPKASVLTVAVPAKSQWETQVGQGPLQGVPILFGELAITAESTTSESTALYREYEPPQARSVAATLIPYYAWGNRGHSEMSVWLKVQQ